MSSIILKRTTKGSSCKSSSSSITIDATEGIHSLLHSGAYIQWKEDDSSFYLCSEELDANTIVGVRVSSVRNFQWELLEECYFSFGQNIFKSDGMIEQGILKIECLEGCRKGEIFYISREGASIGRASDNTICIQDPEISRHHLVIVYEQIGVFDEGPLRVGQFHIIDEYSKLGTFMLLRGPHYRAPYRLKYDDQIVLSRHHFSVNRFDCGLFDHIGFEARMESYSIIHQDLDMETLRDSSYFPVSYFAIYDGSFGIEASKFLFKNLHYYIQEGIDAISYDILRLIATDMKGFEAKTSERKRGIESSESSTNEIQVIIINMIKKVFLDIDRNFLIATQGNNEQYRHGSSAVVTLIMGNRVFAVNLGNSSIILSRNFQAFALSQQHVPRRQDESKRVESCLDSFVAHNNLQGVLSVTRAIGHGDMKKYIFVNNENGNESERKMTSRAQPVMTLDKSASFLLCEPDIEVTRLKSTDQFIIMCCNGLLGLFKSPQVLIDLVKYTLIDMNGDTQKCASKVIEIAIKQKNALKNISLIIILIHKWF